MLFLKQKLVKAFLVIILPLSFIFGCAGRYSNAIFKLIANNALKAQDGGFNQAAWEGMLKVDANLDEDLDVLHPDTNDNPNMITPAITKTIDDGYRAVVLPGFTYIKTVIQKSFFDVYNDTYFLAIDISAYQDIIKNNNNEVDKYYEILVDESKPGFAAAIDIAGQIFNQFKKDKNALELPVITDTLGNITVRMTSIGGLNIFPIQNYMIGFNKGLRWFTDNVLANDPSTKDGKLQFEWLEGSFNGGFGSNDAIKGAQVNTKVAITNQVGVIFNISVPETNTVLKEMAAVDGKKPWFVGVDVDQARDANLVSYKNLIKTSALKDITFATQVVLSAINDRILNNDIVDPENEYSPAGTKSFIWSKTKQVSLVPMNNQDFEDFYKELVGVEQIENLKNKLDIDASELRQCNKIDMLGDIYNEPVCKATVEKGQGGNYGKLSKQK